MYQSKTQIKNYNMIEEALMAATILDNGDKLEVYLGEDYLSKTPDIIAELILDRDDGIQFDMSC